MTQAIPERRADRGGNAFHVALATALQGWRARRRARKTTRLLTQLSDHMLKDIGLMRDRTGLLHNPIHFLPGAAVFRR